MHFDSFPSHFRLMLLASRTNVGSAETRQMQKTAEQPIDWQELLRVALSHRLAPLVLNGLTTARISNLPPAVSAVLRERTKANSLQALRCSLEIQRISKAFAAAGLSLISLKGPALAQLIFGDPAARHTGDIDLLACEGDPLDQIRRMKDLGYTLVNPTCRLTPKRMTSYRRFWKDLTFHHASSGLMVDLHWRLFNNRHNPANRLLEPARTCTLRLYGAEVLTLSQTDQFIYCCAHGLSDGWVYLKGLADIAAFLRKLSPFEVEEVFARSAELGLLMPVSIAVMLAGEWMNAPVDPSLLPQGSAAAYQPFRDQVIRNLIRHDYKPQRTPAGLLETIAIELGQAPGLRSAAEIAARYVFRPRVWSAVPLPDTWFWLYPVVGLLLPPHLRLRQSGH